MEGGKCSLLGGQLLLVFVLYFASQKDKLYESLAYLSDEVLRPLFLFKNPYRK